jgi:hypothetical protein
VFGGEGLEKMSLAAPLESPVVKLMGQDIYVRGRTLGSPPLAEI